MVGRSELEKNKDISWCLITIHNHAEKNKGKHSKNKGKEKKVSKKVTQHLKFYLCTSMYYYYYYQQISFSENCHISRYRFTKIQSINRQQAC